MVKIGITALYLSQALIGGTYADDYTRWVHTIHVYDAGLRTFMVEDWYTYKQPVPYYRYWNCDFKGQTAQQCVAIHSMLDQELNGVDQSVLADELRALKDRIIRKRMLDSIR